jgi:hypothetical protein
MTFTVNRRDGLYSLHRAAKELCRLVVTFAPVIERLYPDNDELQTALAAALAACQALDALVVEQTTTGI